MFIEPTLLIKEDLGDLSADVILVSARGAAGKSRTATQLAAEINAPLWRLEKDSAVSRAALGFNLDRYTSSANYLAQVPTLAAKPVLLIDSLDEARARVSARSWDEFLDSIIEAAEKGLRCVIFGRERTLEEAWVKLADSGTRIAWLEVSHFETDSWTTYIDGRVAAGERSSATKGSYYVSARDSILTALSDSLTPETAESFVGYAPVLDAVATTLRDEQNHYSLLQEFESTTGSARHIDVLRQILNGLLIREQGKLSPVARELKLPESLIFSPREQLEWLWRELQGSQEPSLDYIGDEAKQHEYKRSIGTFIEDHPFRSDKSWASAVFEAFAAAEMLASLPEDLLIDVGNRSGLLFDFTTSVNDSLVISEAQFAALHSSLLEGGSREDTSAVTLSQSDDFTYTGSMRADRASGTLAIDLALIPTSDETISITGPLEALTLFSKSDVHIVGAASGSLLGPDLFIACRNLSFAGEEISFAKTVSGAGDESAGIRFEVHGSSLALPSTIGTLPAENTFELGVIESTVVRYPWTPFRVLLEDDEDRVDPNSRAIRFLHKLQSLARTHGHSGNRATYYMKLQGRQQIKSDRLRAVLAILEHQGAIQTDGDMIFITSAADLHRFSGKKVPGQRTINQEWGYWGQIVEEIEAVL